MASDPSRIAFLNDGGIPAVRQEHDRAEAGAGALAKKRAREGRCEGRKPFGYYPGEKTALDRISALRNEGLGFDRIAARLNDEGIPTRTGKRWHGVVVNRILTGRKSV